MHACMKGLVLFQKYAVYLLSLIRRVYVQCFCTPKWAIIWRNHRHTIDLGIICSCVHVSYFVLPVRSVGQDGVDVWVTNELCLILASCPRHLSDCSLCLPASSISGRLNKLQLIGRWWQTSQAQFIAVWRQPIHFSSVAHASPHVDVHVPAAMMEHENNSYQKPNDLSIKQAQHIFNAVKDVYSDRLYQQHDSICTPPHPDNKWCFIKLV